MHLTFYFNNKNVYWFQFLIKRQYELRQGQLPVCTGGRPDGLLRAQHPATS
ncbi:Uncharacterized protein ChrSV_3691 [Chromobacterium vaccinii]|nr:Uncharacterized protein ChrSW_3691 [Chromobacterium vaccinii]QND91148.1 Uncharacterized protein ChrSV_3691 [Chromobacterium vaccinii]